MMDQKAKLVKDLMKKGYLQSESVIKAFRGIQREDFVPEEVHSKYEDCPFGIGYNATISAPHMHAIALELLEPKLRLAKRSLDVGSGTG